VLAAKANLEPVMTTLVNKIPFDSQYKYMSTHYQIGGEEQILITGAPDVISPCAPAADPPRCGSLQPRVLGKRDGALCASGAAHGCGGVQAGERRNG
jgi:magnesium-transporting ATPase (P-type)